jgi:hypothetical protein
MAGVLGRAGSGSEALALLDEALARVNRTGERWFEAELHRLKGEALLASSSERAGEAEACYLQALAVAQNQGARLWELRATTSLARLWRDSGPARRGARPPRASLRLVHRGLRHRRPQGRQGAARRVGRECTGAPSWLKAEVETRLAIDLVKRNGYLCRGRISASQEELQTRCRSVMG